MRDSARRSHETHFCAVLEFIALTIVALKTRLAWADGNTVANYQIANLSADSFNNSRHLMPEDNRVSHANRAEPTILIIMHVRPANAAMGHRDKNVVGPQICKGNLINAQIVLFMKNTGFDGHDVS
jgi:hypothetical protein